MRSIQDCSDGDDISLYTSRRAVAISSLTNCLLALATVVVLLGYVIPAYFGTLFCVSKTHSFGSVEAGKQLQHQFKLRNLQLWPVYITGVTSECGCAAATGSRKLPARVMPYEEFTLFTSVDTRGWNGKTRKKISVFVDGQELQLALEAEGR